MTVSLDIHGWARPPGCVTHLVVSLQGHALADCCCRQSLPVVTTDSCCRCLLPIVAANVCCWLLLLLLLLPLMLLAAAVAPAVGTAGILGPVVLQAAVGAQYAPLGMLATVALYLQQLPLAQLLFQAHHQQQQQQHRVHLITTADSGVETGGFSSRMNGIKVATSPEPCDSSHVNGLHAGARAMNGVSSANSDSSSSDLLPADSNNQSHLRHLHHTAATPHAAAATKQQQQHSFSVETEPSQTIAHALKATQARNAFGSTGSLLSHGQQQAGLHARRLSWDMEQQQQRHVDAEAGGCSDSRPLLGSTGRLPQQQGFAAYTLSLFLKVGLVAGQQT